MTSKITNTCKRAALPALLFLALVMISVRYARNIPIRPWTVPVADTLKTANGSESYAVADHNASFIARDDQTKNRSTSKSLLDEHQPEKRCFLLTWNESETERLHILQAKSTSLQSCNRFVTADIYQARGRTGNQMFKFASLLGIAYKYDVIPIIPTSFALRKYFNLPNVVDMNLTNNEVCNANPDGNLAIYVNCTNTFKQGGNVTMYGYLESWKYFINASDVIKKCLILKSIHLLRAALFLRSNAKAGYQRVAIHVRRTDMVEYKLTDINGYTNFIERAKQIYIEKYNNVQFIVVSDDIPWCESNLNGVLYSPFQNPGDDMAMMSLCDHVIVTSGTFGWWGGWLSGGTVVYFKGFPLEGTAWNRLYNRDDYYPPNWIGL